MLMDVFQIKKRKTNFRESELPPSKLPPPEIGVQ